MKNIVIKGWMVAIAVFVCIFGGIYLTIGTGHWATTRTAEPVKLETGEYNPADIRGSYTFSEIEKFFNVPADLLFRAFMIPEDLRTPTFQIKNMENMFAPVIIDGTEIEVGTDLIRVFTAIHSGLPYESDETTHLPLSAVKLLVQENKLNDEQKTYWETHTFELVPAEEAPAPEEGVEEHAEIEVKGGTTMGELLEYGLTKEQFKEITGVEMPDNNALGLRDFVTENGLDMETVKTKILEILAPTPAEETPAAEKPEETLPPTPSAEEKPVSEEEPETVIDIKGRTTFAELLGYGMTKEKFKEIAGVDMPDDDTMKLKDFADANGLDMDTLKTQLLEALQQ